MGSAGREQQRGTAGAVAGQPQDGGARTPLRWMWKRVSKHVSAKGGRRRAEARPVPACAGEIGRAKRSGKGLGIGSFTADTFGSFEVCTMPVCSLLKEFPGTQFL